MQPTLFFDLTQCSFGTLLVAQSTKGLAAIFIGEHASALIDHLKKRFPKMDISQNKVLLQPLMSQVINQIENPHQTFDYPLDLHGSDFQIRVWQELKKIPFGKTATYSEVAQHLQMPKAVRAIANACGANPIAIIIPCHRVIRKDSSLSGYRWGVAIKKQLLAFENA